MRCLWADYGIKYIWSIWFNETLLWCVRVQTFFGSLGSIFPHFKTIFLDVSFCLSIMFHKLYKLLPLFLSQFKVYICSRKIMTGDRRAAPSVPGTPTTPVYLLNETTASDEKQSGSHSPKKFMSELHSIHSKLNNCTLSFCFSRTCGQLTMNKLYAYTVMLMTVRVWLEKKDNYAATQD